MEGFIQLHNDIIRRFSIWSVGLFSEVARTRIDKICHKCLVNQYWKSYKILWSRLDEYYGNPVMIEAALKKRLNNVQKIMVKGYKILYELSNVLSEIQAIKERTDYSDQLGYYVSSSGVTPIVNKLPHNIQENWVTSAVRYKIQNDVIYPPFSFFLSHSSKTRQQSNMIIVWHSRVHTLPLIQMLTNMWYVVVKVALLLYTIIILGCPSLNILWRGKKYP